MKKTTSLLYGIHPVKEAIESGKTIDKVWIQEGRLQGQLAELLTLFRDNRILWRQVPSEKLNSLVRGNHQGVVVSLSVVLRFFDNNWSDARILGRLVSVAGEN